MIQYGIAGFGLHAAQRLMPGFARARNSTALALSRRSFAKAQADAVRFGMKYAYASTRELCACPEIDAVFVTSPNAVHLEDVLTAIEHGKHVLCEKPMGMNAREVEWMIAAARSRGVLLGVAHCFRFCESLGRIREGVRQKLIGRVIGIRSDFSFPGENSARVWLTDATLAGGGPIVDVGVHCLDTMRYILDDEPLGCSALAVSDSASGTVEAAALLSLRFSKGVLGSSFVSFRAPYRTAVEVTGTEGSIVAEECMMIDRPVTIEFRTGSGVRRDTLSNVDAYVRQVDAFSAAIKGGSEFPATAEDGLQNQRILDTLLHSARNGAEIAIPAT